MPKYLDYDGLSYFKEKLDENLDSKVATIKQAIFQESYTPDLEVGYALSGLSEYNSTGTLNEDDTVFAIWTDTSTSIVYAGIAEVYSIDTDLCITFITLSEVNSSGSTQYMHNIVVKLTKNYSETDASTVKYNLSFNFIDNNEDYYYGEDFSTWKTVLNILTNLCIEGGNYYPINATLLLTYGSEIDYSDITCVFMNSAYYASRATYSQFIRYGACAFFSNATSDVNLTTMAGIFNNEFTEDNEDVTYEIYDTVVEIQTGSSSSDSGTSSTTYYQHIVHLSKTGTISSGGTTYDYQLLFTVTVVNDDSSNTLTLSDIESYLTDGNISPSSGTYSQYTDDGVYAIGTPTEVFYDSGNFYVRKTTTNLSTGSVSIDSIGTQVWFTSSIYTNCTIQYQSCCEVVS